MGVRKAVVVGALLAASARGVCASEPLPLRRDFTLERQAEVLVTFTASCKACDWSAAGREAAALAVQVDGTYSQHVLIPRSAEAKYVVFLGPLSGGRHTLSVAGDPKFSAKDAGEVEIARADVHVVESTWPEYAWLAEAPILHARPGTVERFSDVPLAMYAEALAGRRGYRYTVIFSHEDGGTPTDRLMATWGRATDIEFVYEVERMPDGTMRKEYQGPRHEVRPFTGERAGSHPLLWVSTDNNMVSDRGPTDAVRFAIAPQLVDLTDVSRETYMDANPWLYAVMAAELAREGRIAPAAAAGSGQIPDPLEFGYVEACGELHDATLAFDVAVESHGKSTWHATDREDARFRIARSGCFRAAVPLPRGTQPSQIHGLRARAYTRPPRQEEAPLAPGSGKATLTRVNAILMLNDQFTPVQAGRTWTGALELRGDGTATVIPLSTSAK